MPVAFIRRSFITCAVVLVNLIGHSTPGFAEPNWDVWADHNLLNPSQNVYIVDPQANTVVVPFETSGQIVEINDGVGGRTYFAYWDMKLICSTAGEDIIDQDVAGQNVTTNGNGHWEHLAHGIGALGGQKELSPDPDGDNSLAIVEIRVDAIKYRPGCG